MIFSINGKEIRLVVTDHARTQRMTDDPEKKERLTRNFKDIMFKEIIQNKFTMFNAHIGESIVVKIPDNLHSNAGLYVLFKIETIGEVMYIVVISAIRHTSQSGAFPFKYVELRSRCTTSFTFTQLLMVSKLKEEAFNDIIVEQEQTEQDTKKVYKNHKKLIKKYKRFNDGIRLVKRFKMMSFD